MLMSNTLENESRILAILWQIYYRVSEDPGGSLTSSSEGFNIFCKLHIFVSWLVCDLLPEGIDYPMEQLTEGIGKRVAPLTIEGPTFCNISEEPRFVEKSKRQLIVFKTI
jgi:hypothetical protein